MLKNRPGQFSKPGRLVFHTNQIDQLCNLLCQFSWVRMDLLVFRRIFQRFLTPYWIRSPPPYKYKGHDVLRCPTIQNKSTTSLLSSFPSTSSPRSSLLLYGHLIHDDDALERSGRLWQPIVYACPTGSLQGMQGFRFQETLLACLAYCAPDEAPPMMCPSHRAYRQRHQVEV